MALCPAAVLAEEEMQMPDHSQPSALDPFKKLAGSWKGQLSLTTTVLLPKKPVVTYAVTAAGSAVIETMFCDSAEDEMVTIYFHGRGEPYT